VEVPRPTSGFELPHTVGALSEPSMTNWRERWKPSQIESKDGRRR